MEFKLNKVNGSYLHVNISGECTREEIIEIPNRIKEYCDNRYCSSVLIDSRNLNVPTISILDQHSFGKSIANTLGPSISLAILGDENIFSHFAETVADNRGANIKISNNLDVLLSWLDNN